MPSQTNFSRKRAAILEALRSAKEHPTAEWVYQRVKPLYPDLSLGTVYRNLAGFKRDGVVRTVAVVGGQERFDADVSEHVHFICEGCGAVIDWQAGDRRGPEAGDQTWARPGFAVTECQVLLRGLCPGCAAKNA
jgi:Fur family peroxide stress response transcriptional regulator